MADGSSQRSADEAQDEPDWEAELRAWDTLAVEHLRDLMRQGRLPCWNKEMRLAKLRWRGRTLEAAPPWRKEDDKY